MGTRTQLLPALGMPRHIFLCPQSLVLPGAIFAFVSAGLLSFVINAFEIMIMINYALWHVYWAARYQINPWVYEGISTRVRVGTSVFSSNKTLFKENGWAWYV